MADYVVIHPNKNSAKDKKEVLYKWLSPTTRYITMYMLAYV